MARRKAVLWRRDPRPGVLVIAGGVALLLFLGLVAAVVLSPAFVTFDEAASAAFHDIQSSTLTTFSEAATQIADFWIMLGLTLVTSVVLWVLGRRPEVALLVSVMAIGPLIGAVAKDVVERARPGLEYARIALPESYSFPSGHALAAFLFFGTIAFIVLVDAKSFRVRVWTVGACVVAILIVSLSRVYLGVHWFGDIIASWALGFGIMSLATAIYFVVTTDDSGSST